MSCQRDKHSDSERHAIYIFYTDTSLVVRTIIIILTGVFARAFTNSGVRSVICACVCVCVCMCVYIGIGPYVSFMYYGVLSCSHTSESFISKRNMIFCCVVVLKLVMLLCLDVV